MMLYVDQQFAKIFPFRADFRSRTCRATRGPADVRRTQLTARTGLILTNQGTGCFTRCLFPMLPVCTVWFHFKTAGQERDCFFLQ